MMLLPLLRYNNYFSAFPPTVSCSSGPVPTLATFSIFVFCLPRLQPLSSWWGRVTFPEGWNKLAASIRDVCEVAVGDGAVALSPGTVLVSGEEQTTGDRQGGAWLGTMAATNLRMSRVQQIIHSIHQSPAQATSRPAPLEEECGSSDVNDTSPCDKTGCLLNDLGPCLSQLRRISEDQHTLGYPSWHWRRCLPFPVWCKVTWPSVRGEVIGADRAYTVAIPK